MRGAPGRRNPSSRPRRRAARSVRARASARWKRRIRARVFAPYPNAARERRWSCRALSPTSSAASATRRPRRSSRTTSWRAGSGGIGAARSRCSASDSSAASRSGASASTSATSRTRASPQTSASATRRSRSSIAGSPSRDGASPGPSRIASSASPSPWYSCATVSGPATNSRPSSLAIRSMHPSGSTRTTPAAPASRCQTTDPPIREGRSRYIDRRIVLASADPVRRSVRRGPGMCQGRAARPRIRGASSRRRPSRPARSRCGCGTRRAPSSRPSCR